MNIGRRIRQAKKLVYVKTYTRNIGLFDSTRVRSHYRSSPFHRKLKRPNIPPTNRQGLETYFRNHGFRINPILENFRDAIFTFDKPLPDGSRIHGEVQEGERKWRILMHFDGVNPYKDPFGHLSKDLQVRHHTKVFKVKKARIKRPFWDL
jgi:hypothetical protein